MSSRVVALLLSFISLLAHAEPLPLRAELERRIPLVMPHVVAWRRDLHQHPELSNQEARTSQIVAKELRRFGLKVQTGMAHHGVVGLLEGAKPGPVVALRADMDALPVTEATQLAFASKVKTTYNGQETGVMHACGHDAHVAMLLGVAEVLSGMRAQLPGTVKFIFQPAEEGTPPGEPGGAALMVKEGVLKDPKPAAIFGLHAGITPAPVGTLSYKTGGLMAAVDLLNIEVKGVQTHGAVPWKGVDPVVVGAQIVLALQTLTSRQVDLTIAPAVVTIGSFHAGIRSNIISDVAKLQGTVRTFDPAMRKDLLQRIRRTAKLTAEAAGATAEVTLTPQTPVTHNDPALAQKMRPTLERVVGAPHVKTPSVVTTGEDFAFYQLEIPGLFLFLGAATPGVPPEKVAPNHSPLFNVDEGALPVGVRTLSHLAVDFLSGEKT